MQALTELRKLARERRDKAILQATRDYNDTLMRIAAVEQDLLGKQRTGHKTIAATIYSAMPQDGPFTINDVIAGLRAMDPLGDWRAPAVTNQIGRLRHGGQVKRIRRATIKQPALYVRVGVEVAPTEYGDMTMLDAAEKLLRERGMTLTELAVCMKESGFTTMMTTRGLRSAVGVAMRRAPERFKIVGGKWVVL
jgi:hypothetical protein